MATSKAVAWVTTLVLLYSATVTLSEEDLPCRAQDVGIEGRSIVCVCTADYCDTITREDPEPGTYVMYTSSNAGQRFAKSSGFIQPYNPPVTNPPESDDNDSEADEGTNPDDGDNNPGDGDNNPGGEDNNPGDGDNNPGEGDNNPGDGDNNPGGEDNNPGEGDNNPGGEDNNPGGDDNNPGEGDNNPGEGDNNPGEGENNPGGEDSNPGGDNNNPGGDDNNPGGEDNNPGTGEGDNAGENDADVTDDDEEEFNDDRVLYDDDDSEGSESTIWNRVHLRIFPLARHQYIEGFGGSVTDAASINWRKLSDETQQKMIDTYFGPKGIEYNLIRVPIGGCDFSTHPYTYNEEPWYDAALSNFSLTSEDNFYKLPMIKRSQEVATDEIKITASTWSPPIWMKTNERITGFGQLRPEYYQAYADYHVRFMEEYEKAEVKIWAITTTNEPINGIVPFVDFNSLGWTPSQLGRFVANNLVPTIRNSPYNKTLILAVDDQRYILPFWLRGMEREDPKSIEYIDGIAIHYYGNFFPASILTTLHERYPGKIMLSTEACEGPMPWDALQVEIGSWRRARRYVTSILEDLNNFVVGWIDWNLCLDPTGGPNWAHNYVDAPILVYADGEDDYFIKQPMFYAMGHFSKFVPRGSRRLRVSRRSLVSLENLAVIKENGNYVVILQNRRTREMHVRLSISSTRYIEFVMEPESIKTIEMNPN